MLKVSPNATGDSVARLRELVTGLRQRGYPAARLLASGQVVGLTFWLQERLPGTVDWSLRHHPGTRATAHHPHLARLVTADLAERS